MSAHVAAYERDAKPAEIAETLRRDGAVIVREVLAPDVMDQLAAGVTPYLHNAHGAVYGGKTKTCSNLFAYGPEFSEHLLTNPLVLDVLDGTLLPEHPMGPSGPTRELRHGYDYDDPDGKMRWDKRDAASGPNCHHYRVHFGGSIQVGTGGELQPLHREMDIFRPYIEHDPDQPDWVVAVNYASCDFTAENGATRVVPGSHRWPRGRKPRPEDEAQAVMPKGSAIFWLGRTFHALGANRTPQVRTGIISIFSVNWLTQEENQFVGVPRELVEELPEQAQRLLGYRSAAVGYVMGRDAENLLRPGGGQPI